MRIERVPLRMTRAELRRIYPSTETDVVSVEIHVFRDRMISDSEPRETVPGSGSLTSGIDHFPPEIDACDWEVRKAFTGFFGSCCDIIAIKERGVAR